MPLGAEAPEQGVHEMPGGDGSNPGGAAGSGNDRMIIVVQLIVGALLVMFAALLLVIFKVTNVLGGSGDLTAGAGSVATGVLGVGAALLPSGAAASASARILQGLPSQPAAQREQFAQPKKGTRFQEKRLAQVRLPDSSRDT